jgi:hypothetical protein
MSALDELLSELRKVCTGLEDKRLGQACRYTMADMAAFSVFFMQSPSFLGHQRALAEGHGRSNCQTLLWAWWRPSLASLARTLDFGALRAPMRLWRTVLRPE